MYKMTVSEENVAFMNDFNTLQINLRVGTIIIIP